MVVGAPAVSALSVGRQVVGRLRCGAASGVYLWSWGGAAARSVLGDKFSDALPRFDCGADGLTGCYVVGVACLLKRDARASFLWVDVMCSVVLICLILVVRAKNERCECGCVGELLLTLHSGSLCTCYVGSLFPRM